jgi:nicotinamidase-related amidase
MINKHTFNAFHGNTTLLETLATAGNGSPITTLVVMGTETNICIDATIGPENIKRKFTPDAEGAGAIDHGFTVLTCQDVLTGRDEIWANKSPNIKFYSNI